MVDAELVKRRLQRLDEYVEILKRLRRYSSEEFLGEPERYGSAERFMQLSIELINDLGNHVVADDGLGTVAVSADVPRLLASHGILDTALAEQWVKMIGFRNILVHEYLNIDRRLVYETLGDNLEDFDRLRSVFAGLL